MNPIDPAKYKHIVFFAGAGMSAKSGVATYRGRGDPEGSRDRTGQPVKSEKSKLKRKGGILWSGKQEKDGTPTLRAH